MQLFYGTYGFPVNGTQIGSSTETVYNEGGVPYKVRQKLSCSGYLAVNGQADCALQETAMRTALAIPFQDVAFLQDNGALTPLVLTDFGSITGVRVTRLRFPTTKGAEYATYRTFEVEFEAEYALPAAALSPFAALLSFEETLVFSGGDSVFKFRNAVLGPNAKQLVFPQVPYRATQMGTAKGRIAPPIAPSQIWPFALMEPPKFTRSSPKLEGTLFEGYGLTWQYEFADNGPLIGFPHLWPD